MHTSIIIRTEWVIFRNMYVYAHTYVHEITISEKGGHKFEREQGGVYGQVLREVKEGRNVAIKL